MTLLVFIGDSVRQAFHILRNQSSGTLFDSQRQALVLLCSVLFTSDMYVVYGRVQGVKFGIFLSYMVKNPLYLVTSVGMKMVSPCLSVSSEDHVGFSRPKYTFLHVYLCFSYTLFGKIVRYTDHIW